MEGGGWLQLHSQVAVPEVVSYVIYGWMERIRGSKKHVCNFVWLRRANGRDRCRI
ncbi:hypothetical protein PVAP13_6NG344050 [Panicum virgatum]|uniref:Uncharacterized protein n=1 Tax=Panicum virgatum TaxID=38727 RepID=A0A8T0R5P4_PANVG|nr:hypothetical protein PVAP13_6NG344050 [Panicum virgatum]